MPDEICHQCNGKQQRGGLAADMCSSRLGYEQNQKATHYCSCLGHQNEFTVVGEIYKPCTNVNLLFLLGSFVLMVLYLLGKEGGREERGY